MPSRPINSLYVVNHPEPRWYIECGRRIILTGTLDQRVPDTLFRTDSLNIENFAVSRAAPGVLYFCAAEPFPGKVEKLIHSSTDDGRTWRMFTGPPFAFEDFIIIPSNVYPDVFVAIATPLMSTHVAGMGVWKCREYGYTGRLTHGALHPSVWCELFDDDKLLRLEDYHISTDYGYTWVRNDSGIHPAYKNTAIKRSWVTRKKMIIANDSLWYQYASGMWRRMRMNDGTPIGRWASNDCVEIGDNTLYASYQNDGLYRLNNATMTDVARPPIAHSALTLDAYPNPFSTGVSISVGGATPGARLVVRDLFGREILTRPIGSTSRMLWDGRGEDGVVVPSGTYFIIVTDGAKIEKRTVFRFK